LPRSFVDSIHLNLHSLEVYYKDGRTGKSNFLIAAIRLRFL
jgi:hypothetical protein